MPYCDPLNSVVWPVVQRALVKGLQAGYQHLEDFPHNSSSPGGCLCFTEQLSVLLSSVIWQSMACSGHFNPFSSLQIVLTEKIWKPRKWQRKRAQLKQQERDNVKWKPKGEKIYLKSNGGGGGRWLKSLINSGFKEKKKLKMKQRAKLALEREKKKRCWEEKCQGERNVI